MVSTKKPVKSLKRIGIKPGGSSFVKGVGLVILRKDSQLITIIPESDVEIVEDRELQSGPTPAPYTELAPGD